MSWLIQGIDNSHAIFKKIYQVVSKRFENDIHVGSYIRIKIGSKKIKIHKAY